MDLLDDMAVFLRVAEHGSFTAGAATLGIAKSVASRRVAALERRFGVTLFHRTTRRLSLTEGGRTLAQRARRITDEVAETEDALRSLQGELSGLLRVAAPMSFSTMHLGAAVAEFMARHPHLEIELDLNDRRVNLVDEGFDLAIRIGELEDSTLTARGLAPCRHVVCASPAYLARRGTPTTLEDLAGHDGLIYSNRVLDPWRFRVNGKWRHAAPAGRRFSAGNGEVLRDAAAAGLGLVVLPTFIAGAYLARGDLRAVLAGYELVETRVYALWSPQRQLPAKARAFVEFAAARFGPEPCWDTPRDAAATEGAG